MKGLFISFEGVEGSGKSSQAKALHQWLVCNNQNCLLIREPGATPIGERIRDIIVDVNNTDMVGLTEAYLYAAARAQLVNEVIKPALAQGKTIICDRFVDSSYAYQGIARGLGLDTVQAINAYAVGNTLPDITFFINIDPKTGLARKTADGEINRFEQEKLEFHQKVYGGYLQLAAMFSQRFITIDGTKAIDEVLDEIVSQLQKKFSIR